MDTKRSLESKALVKAAKIICELKSGLCPIREEDFSGCPFACTEDIRPWQCWVAYLTAHAGRHEERGRHAPLRLVA